MGSLLNMEQSGSVEQKRNICLKFSRKYCEIKILKKD